MSSILSIARSLLVLMTLAALPLLTAPTAAQVMNGNRTTAHAANITDALARLPASEAVMYFDVRRLLNEALPRAFGDSPRRLDRINRDIETFRARTGIDARRFDTVAVALDIDPRLKSLFPPRFGMRANPVVVARGSFDANEIYRAGREAVRGDTAIGGRVARERESRHKGRALYTVQIEDNVRAFGLIDLGEREVAVSALDANTLLVGKPSAVRSAIDANTGGTRVDAGIVRDATRLPDAIIGFAAVIPARVASRIDLRNDELTRRFRDVRAINGGISILSDGFAAQTILRTTDEKSAGELRGTLAALQFFLPGIIRQIGAQLGRTVVADNLRNVGVTTEGSEVTLRGEFITRSDAARVGTEQWELICCLTAPRL